MSHDNFNGDGSGLFGIFDGHGGSQVSEFSSETIPNVSQDAIRSSSRNCTRTRIILRESSPEYWPRLMSSWNLWEPAILEALAALPMWGRKERGSSATLLIWATPAQLWTLMERLREWVWITSQPPRARSNVSSITYSTQEGRRIHCEGQSLRNLGCHSRPWRSWAQDPRSIGRPGHRRGWNHQQDQLFNHCLWRIVGRVRGPEGGGSLQRLRADQHDGFDFGQVCEDERKQGQCQRHDS